MRDDLFGEVKYRNYLDRPPRSLVAELRKPLSRHQLAVLDSKSRECSVCCSRRSGKTFLFTVMLFIAALSAPEALARYWAESRLRAKERVWDRLLRINDRLDIGGKANITELSIKLPNGSEIRLTGADKARDAEKKRGDLSVRPILEVIDEAQAYGSFLGKIVNDICSPGLADLRGRLILSGTPGPVCGGYWYFVSGAKSGDASLVKGFERFHWTAKDNVAEPHIWRELREIKERRGWADDNPTWLREGLGLWVDDPDALFFKYQTGRNDYDTEVISPMGDGWAHVIGWDLGKNHNNALSILAFHADDPNVYEAFSWKPSQSENEDVHRVVDSLSNAAEIHSLLRGLKRETTTDGIMGLVRGMADGGLNIVGRVADTGGLGGVLVEEVAKRTGVRFEAAKKTERDAHVRLINDAYLSGKIKLRPGSPLHEEVSSLEKDPDWPPFSAKPAPPRPGQEDHCSDSHLYAYMLSYHWTHERAQRQPKKGTQEYYEAQEQELVEHEEEKAQRDDSRDWWEE